MFTKLAKQIKQWGRELGFDQVGISDAHVAEHPQAGSDLSTLKDFRNENPCNIRGKFFSWLTRNDLPGLSFMRRHIDKRLHPEQLVPNTQRIICCRMNYFPEKHSKHIARYAMGKNYHRFVRKRLQALADRIQHVIGDLGYRAFVDSAPVLEKALAEKAGLGWIGKHTNLLCETGSWFFLGELFVDLPLPVDRPIMARCGDCTACLEACPNQALIAPYQLDVSRCIAYWTVEHRGVIPETVRPLLGQQVFGCDRCQEVCHWNRYATVTRISAFSSRPVFLSDQLMNWLNWCEQDFLRYARGTSLYRLGYEHWLRNVAVALGNSPTHDKIISALKNRLDNVSQLVKMHVLWALRQQLARIPHKFP